MKHFILKIDKDVKTERKFQAIHFNCSMELTAVQDLQKLRSLEITCYNLDRKMFANALANINHLENLSVSTSFGTNSNLFELEAVPLLHLKKLWLKNSSRDVLASIKTTSLISLTIQNISRDDMTTVIELLMNQPLLENLKIVQCYDELNDELFMHEVLTSFPFKLKSFKIKKCNIRNLSTEVINFLKCHEQTLEKIALNSYISPEVLTSILRGSFSNLKTLKIDVQSVPDIKIVNFWRELPSRFDVHELKVYNSFVNLKVAILFLTRFSSLKRFNVIKHDTTKRKPWFGRLLPLLPKFMPRLEHLDIPNFIHPIVSKDPRIYFPCLKKFRIKKVWNSLFIHFLRNHRNLEEISIKQLQGRNKELLYVAFSKVLSECCNLKTFFCGAGFSKTMIEKIISKEISWILKLSKSKSEWINKPSEKYIFPDDAENFKNAKRKGSNFYHAYENEPGDFFFGINLDDIFNSLLV
jgi:hypothetical protein